MACWKQFLILFSVVQNGAGLIMRPLSGRNLATTRKVRCQVHVTEILMASAQGIRMDLSDLPPWVQQGLTSAGVDYFSVPEQMRYLLFQQIFLVFLGIYVSRSQFGDASFEARDQAFSDEIREERRRRSGFDRPKTLDDVAPSDEWFENDDKQ
mmetsp:Transcript_6016/g.8512  ORF Transcript_6016/g.8512 Transcript_6016/m.8512 type:complete len:153 (+) Transcript_6016:26-484(+)|eukprot:CAMPEP_0197309698 /NCGR_PEP_ID=MMETSP0891-20130614/8315_1 /TAXON_ID=44058 ORGANISM="Aureoumbra lagunensis, Strain CCMP1510" /NCGR_SAMPLE_ID=MMETSP0891 /ASSEMBLY_ACC=CAM_ASM_000534 /LENGTH=152 /DNA_ID=CAMNT_0042794951 /DNA_START=34 /DNA_END=492 /DNA_ORIENTATION=+